MKLTKGKLSKLFNKKKQSHKKKKNHKKNKKSNTFRRNKRTNLANKTLRILLKKCLIVKTKLLQGMQFGTVSALKIIIHIWSNPEPDMDPYLDIQKSRIRIRLFKSLIHPQSPFQPDPTKMS